MVVLSNDVTGLQLNVLPAGAVGLPPIVAEEKTGMLTIGPASTKGNAFEATTIVSLSTHAPLVATKT